MRGRLDEAGVRRHAVIIKSNGGEMTLEAAADAPVHMVVSGPTGGVIASRHVAGLSASTIWSRSTWAAPRPTSRP